MAELHHLPKPLIRFITLTVCFALLFSAATGIPVRPANGKASRTRQQGNGQNVNERRVAPLPPRTDPPAANLPDLNEIKHARVESPRAPLALPSMMRSRRKPLEARNGRRVGDSLPPIVR